MDEPNMPHNLVGASDEPGARGMRISEEQWRRENLPAEPLKLRWRYTGGALPLYERRLRSLGAYHVGPALQAWVRARLEWIVAERMCERPDGVLVIEIGTQGEVDMRLEPISPMPAFGPSDLLWEDGLLAGCAVPGSLWVFDASGYTALANSGHELHAAADTLVRDLAETLGHVRSSHALTRETVAGAELFVANDEHGIIACAGNSGPVCAKMQECFEKVS